MEVITDNALGLPTCFAPHPFSMSEIKASTTISKHPADKAPLNVTKRGQQFYMDFGFMQASTEDYSRPDNSKDRVVTSYDGYNSYLVVVDEISRYVWVFLTQSKEPPLDIINAFLAQYGNKDGGLIRND